MVMLTLRVLLLGDEVANERFRSIVALYVMGIHDKVDSHEPPSCML